jgi:hypothetical protein
VTANLITASVTPHGSIPRPIGDYLALTNIINVKNYGAKGNGTDNDKLAIQAAFDAAFGTTASPHGGADSPPSSGYYANKAVYFPPGKYITDAPLTLRSVESGLIFGAGTLLSLIYNTTTGSTCIQTNGCSRTTFRDMGFQVAAGSSSVAFSLGWDNTGSPALTRNVFQNCLMTGDYGLDLGPNGYMGSEDLIIGCTIQNCATAGIKSSNGNMLDVSVIGCSISNCGIGIYIQTGAIENIQQCSFAGNTVDIQANSNTVTNVMACRTESATFITGIGTWNVESCNQSAGVGFFLKDVNGSVTLINCQSYAGKIGNTSDHGDRTIIGCNFDRGTAFVTGAADNGFGLVRLTSTGDYWITGDRATVYDVGGVTAANGEWTATRIPSTATVLTSIASPGVITDIAHSLTANTPVVFTTTGALPTGITAGTTYYVKTVSTVDTYTVSASPGGTVIATTGSQSGTHTRTSAHYLDLQGSTFAGTYTPITATVTFTIPGGVVGDTSHGFVANAPVSFSTTGVLPTGITAGTTYYVKTVLTGSTYSISATPGGTAITTSGSQSGTHTRTYSGGGIIHPGNFDDSLSVNYYRGSGSPAGLISQYVERRVTKTSSTYAIPRFLSGSQFDNIGASGAVTFTLPNLNEQDAFKRGTTFGFYVGAAQTLTVQASNGCTIRVAGSVSVSNGTVAASTIGNYIELTCIDGGRDIETHNGIDATKWVAKSVVGTWTVT